ncbi:MMPL family transporter, partial [Klebsiella sp. Kps]|uniref:hypothetical protein n=1 Tax=Klebsiella sp. Kps TaxID=2758579 RepID=UPI0019B2B6D4
GHNEFMILYHSKTLVATDPVYLNHIKQSLSGLKKLPYEYEILYPQGQQISSDKHTAYAVIILKTNTTLSSKELENFTAAIKQPKSM